MAIIHAITTSRIPQPHLKAAVPDSSDSTRWQRGIDSTFALNADGAVRISGRRKWFA
jgi:hypothetical protein